MKDKHLEQQLAEKLGNRKITPSEQAWNRIVRGRQQVKKKNQKIMHYAAGIAACLVVMSFIYTILLESNMPAEPRVVHSNPQKIKKNIETGTTPENIIPIPGNKVVYINNRFEADDTNARHVVEPIDVADANPGVEKEKHEINATVLPFSQALNRNEAVEEETALLLNNALREVAADKILTTRTNDTALLKEVEAEMDEYYREKAMKVFSFKHRAIRIAVKDKQ